MIAVENLKLIFQEKLKNTGSLDQAFTKAVWVAYKGEAPFSRKERAKLFVKKMINRVVFLVTLFILGIVTGLGTMVGLNILEPPSSKVFICFENIGGLEECREFNPSKREEMNEALKKGEVNQSI